MNSFAHCLGRYANGRGLPFYCLRIVLLNGRRLYFYNPRYRMRATWMNSFAHCLGRYANGRGLPFYIKKVSQCFVDFRLL